MKFEQAVKKSIKDFMAGKVPANLMRQSDKGLIYTPEYLDKIEEQMLDAPADTKKIDKKETVDEV
tara:strand:- start:711 stop:905 length:195 start_codon:yes stop_codon:yes gene_type:complete